MRHYLTAVVFTVFSIFAMAHAKADEYADKSKAVAEVLLKASLNSPGSLVIESATVYSRPGPFGNVCGTLRARNAYGGEVRANYVVSDNTTMPVYIGPIPLEVFKKQCSGEVK